MPSFRVLNQAPQYLLPSGKVNAGGTLHFYETDLTTPKNTWSDEAMAVINANPVLLDSAGRTVTDVWGDGEYGVVMSDRLGVELWTRNNVRAEAGAGNLIPALVAGQYLTNDGSILQWQPLRLLPDPTGLENYYLVSDGEQWIAQQIPEPPDPVEPEIIITGDSPAGSFQAGVSDDTKKRFEQHGSDTAPSAPGAKYTTKAVTFGTAFAGVPVVFITNTTGFVSASGDIQPTVAVTSKNASGFTVQFSTAVGEGNSDANIAQPVNFDWLAVGTRTVA